MTSRLPQPVHETEDSSPAPGELDLVRRFLSVHDHERGSSGSLPPSPETIGWWLRTEGLVDDEPTKRDLVWALDVWEALRTKVHQSMGATPDREALDLLNTAAGQAGLRICFGCERKDRFHIEARGVRSAIGRILGLTFLAELDGEWSNLKECDSETCTSVFYDHSKNHSGRWCSMATCGNRNKVRAYRARHPIGS